MLAGRQLAEADRRREKLRAQIRRHRAATVRAVTHVAAPLRWIELGLGLLRLSRRQAGWSNALR